MCGEGGWEGGRSVAPPPRCCCLVAFAHPSPPLPPLLQALNGLPFHHLILRVDFAKARDPNKEGGGLGGLGGGFVSGYGKALPQGGPTGR